MTREQKIREHDDAARAAIEQQGRELLHRMEGKGWRLFVFQRDSEHGNGQHYYDYVVQTRCVTVSANTWETEGRRHRHYHASLGGRLGEYHLETYTGYGDRDHLRDEGIYRTDPNRAVRALLLRTQKDFTRIFRKGLKVFTQTEADLSL